MSLVKALLFALLFLGYVAVVVTALFVSQLSYEDVKQAMDVGRFLNIKRVVTLLGVLVGLGGPPALLAVYLWLRYSAIHATATQNFKASDTLALRAAVDWNKNQGVETTGADARNNTSGRLSFRITAPTASRWSSD